MSHYFVNDESLGHDEHVIKVKINNSNFNFLVDNGVFSKSKLDYGTRLLLETIDVSKIKGNVLDFGCGYGPIGIYITSLTDSNVDMVDVNERCVSLSIKNLKLNGLSANVFVSDIYSNVDKKYDFIITNPPIRVGKKILYSILFDAKKYLVSGGELWLVVHKDQGAKSLVKDLSNEYKVEVKNKDKGFYIICAINN